MRSPVRVSTSWKPLGSLKLLSRLWLKAISGHKVQSLSLIDLDFLPCNWYSMPPSLIITSILSPIDQSFLSHLKGQSTSGTTYTMELASHPTLDEIAGSYIGQDVKPEITDLLPEARLRSNDRMPSSRVLQETCDYIRSLHREVDDLSDRLSELLATSDMSSAQAAIIRSLLM
ncbi:hypothetical protein GUJ93_ZPchr0013g34941 [Zizania palustris]|uniref:BHLH domain-containing protein n=1 Tax=Zizania palustris TaxID=103762 RepID=A0A8J5WU21_ZIZPA|nr:hypothetical protein GUJ93_ZPchr0013g34941 [Zizania palustris]